ncbi:hypothetical protein EV699_10264 [Plasticicumulans lactativorans]|uniref:MOSC domain-containing protein n=1 Tax=Plasticicumulans lactativorans TaxID=1133106 RepID=A0A4R2LJG7_9GAMM|nr:MOSC N-terminal beta barrel domain-containing protein [Plasticicumulans lactativorans]TCO83366.1 hypothetical protein EV699_10264 [Plasticicumulans lactativorans]
MSALRIEALFRYPVKSCRGQPLTVADLDRYGIEDDRRWMVVDAQGRFLTQRQLPRMCLIEPLLAAATLTLVAPGLEPLTVPRGGEGPLREVQVWGDTVRASDAGDDAADWLTEVLDVPARLVELGPGHRRPVDPAYDVGGAEAAFSDGFPLLLIGSASLDGLNARLSAPIGMIRFRPNLVVGGAEAHAEDGWRRLRAGGIELHVVKPCTRCAIPTIDPATGERGREPMATLLKYRRDGAHVIFGQNVIHAGPGRLRVGDAVEVLA